MAWITRCQLCSREKIVSNARFVICQICVDKIIADEKKRKKQIKRDEKKGINRFG